MERIIKIKEYIAIISIFILIWLFAIKNSSLIEQWLYKVSPFNVKFTQILGIYSMLVLIYICISFETIIVNIRVKTRLLKKYALYGTIGMVLINVVFIMPHLITLFLINYKDNYNTLFLIGSTVMVVKLLVERLYIGETFFVLSGKKYYYSCIDKGINDEGTILRLSIQTKEYLVNCGSKKLKRIIISKLEDNSIIINES